MLSRDSFYVPEIEILRGVQAWLEADSQSRFEKIVTLIGSPHSVSLSSNEQQQQQLTKSRFTLTSATTSLISSTPLNCPIWRKNQFPTNGLVSATRSNSSESLFSSASTSDSATSGGMSVSFFQFNQLSIYR